MVLSAAGLVLKLSGQTIDDIISGPAVAGISLETDGTIVFTGNGAPASPADEWVEPDATGIGSSFEARLTVVSGTAPTSGPAAGSWHTISTDREWLLSNGAGTDTGTWDIDIGAVGESTAIVTGRMVVTASVV